MYHLLDRLRDKFHSLFPRRLIIHTLTSGPDWNKGETILHAAFQLLTDYIEVECPRYPLAYDLNPHLAVAKVEMDDLYNWWKVERPRRPTLDDRLEGVPQPTLAEHMVLITEGEDAGDYEYVSRKDEYPDYYAILLAEKDFEAAYYEEDQQNLKRLIAVREFMWT